MVDEPAAVARRVEFHAPASHLGGQRGRIGELVIIYAGLVQHGLVQVHSGQGGVKSSMSSPNGIL